MNLKKIALGVACLVTSAFAFAAGQTSTNYAIPKDAINAGIADMSSANFKLASSVGDAVSTATITSVSFQLSSGFRATVNPAPQTVTFAPASPVTFGVAPITLTATASSGLTAFTFSSGSAASICTVSGNTLTIVGGGTCALTATQAGNANYASASANANVVINPAPQTVTFAPASPVTVGAAPITLTATATSGLTACTFSTSSAASICNVAGNQLSVVAAGTCALTASQAGNANYASASTNANVVIQPVQTLTVFVFGTGQGSVTGTGINCPGDCSEAVAQNTMITLTAAANTGSTFTGWSGGGCSGSGLCTVTMSSAQSVTAQFTRQLGSLSVTVVGLPAGGSVALAITGPDGYSTSNVVTTGITLTLSNLPTGTYTVNAPSKTISNVYYQASARTQSVVVNVGTTATITVTYSVAVLPLIPIIDFVLD